MDMDELQAALDEQAAAIDELAGEVTRLRREVTALREHEAAQVASIKTVSARLRSITQPPATT